MLSFLLFVNDNSSSSSSRRSRSSSSSSSMNTYIYIYTHNSNNNNNNNHDNTDNKHNRLSRGAWRCMARHATWCVTHYITIIIYLALSLLLIIVATIIVSIVKHTPFMPAFALQSFGRNCDPAPASVLHKPIFLYVFFSGGVFFHRHR